MRDVIVEKQMGDAKQMALTGATAVGHTYGSARSAPAVRLNRPELPPTMPPWRPRRRR